MVIALSRPDLLEMRPTWGGGKVNATTVLLEPLTEGDSEALVANLLGRDDVSPDARDRIIDAGGGNPFFVEEIVSMLIDEGLLVRDHGRWIAVADLSHVALPPTISALLAARLDRLEPAERRAIETASVIGGTFSLDAVGALTASGAGDVGTNLRALVRKELVRPAAACNRPGESTSSGTRSSAMPHMKPSPNSSGPTLHERHAGLAPTMGGDTGRGVRGDPGLPPGAGAPVLGRARSGGRARRRARPASRHQARGRRTARRRSRRHLGDRRTPPTSVASAPAGRSAAAGDADALARRPPAGWRHRAIRTRTR